MRHFERLLFANACISYCSGSGNVLVEYINIITFQCVCVIRHQTIIEHDPISTVIIKNMILFLLYYPFIGSGHIRVLLKIDKIDVRPFSSERITNEILEHDTHTHLHSALHFI